MKKIPINERAEYNRSELANGLRVVSLSMPAMNSASLGIWIGVGSRYEQSRFAGISHFLEHLLFKGSRRYSAEQIKRSIEGVGGILNGFTSEEFTCYLIKVLGRDLKACLRVISDMVLEPLLLPKDIDKERAVITEEIRMYKDIPAHYVHEMLDELLWPEHPLGMNIAGTEESVNQIDRTRLNKHQMRYYNPRNMAVVGCGNLDHDSVLEEVTRVFAKATPKDRPPFFKSKVKFAKSVKTKVLNKQTEQTHLSLGVHALPRDHPDRFTLSVLHTILGANMSSRLFRVLREKYGLVYEVSTHIKKFQDTGTFVINAGIDNRRIIKAVRLIVEELRKLKDKPVKKGELLRAKEYCTGGLLLSLEETMDHMLWAGEQVISKDKIHSLGEILKGIGKVKREDIQRLAKRFFNSHNLHLAAIGPIKDKQTSKMKEILNVI